MGDVRKVVAIGTVARKSPRRNCLRQADLERVMRATKVAGFAVERYEIEPETGKIIIFEKNGDGAGSANAALDNWLANNARTTERH